MKTAADNNTYLENILNIFHSTAAKQLFFMLGVTVSVALGIVLYMSIQEPIYRPLDYQITPQNMAALVDTLEKSGIKYKINEKDNVIFVSANDIQLARLKLSAAGIAKDDSFNYSFLNEQNNFGNSQFVENARYLRALESDLSKTINAIEGVQSARVHIAVPQNATFADENAKTTASVVLSLSAGFSSDKEKIRAIVQIVAGSVPGLDPKDVAITDQYGHYLSSSLDQDSMYNAEQLNYQNNIQNYYEKRIESMITPLLGQNKVTVRVYADIDFTRREEAQEQYDPEKKVLRSEQTLSEQVDSSAASGPPGSLSNSPPGEEGDKASSSNNTTKGSQGRSETTKNYELTKSVTYRKSNFAKLNSLSVAVVVDNEVVMDPKTKKLIVKPLDKDKLDKLTQLVQTTVGFNQARGDKVTIINSSFIPVKEEKPIIAVHFWELPWFWDAFKKIGGSLAGFIFLIIIYRRLSNHLKNGFSSETARTIGKIGQVKDSLKSTLIEESNKEADNLKQERIKQLKQLATTEPSRVALIIKNWVGKQ